jgi:hypothetical protein
MKTAIYTTNEPGNSNQPYAYDFEALVSQLQDFKRGLELKLAGSSAGRITLHLLSAVATCHFAWHFQGIARELIRH